MTPLGVLTAVMLRLMHASTWPFVLALLRVDAGTCGPRTLLQFFSAGFEFQGQLDIDFWRADDALEEEEEVVVMVVVEGDLPGNRAFNASVYDWI